VAEGVPRLGGCGSKPDIKRVRELKEELERLERDMRENPASRKPAKAKKVEPEIAVRISAGAVV
jgi:hypothetical protein